MRRHKLSLILITLVFCVMPRVTQALTISSFSGPTPAYAGDYVYLSWTGDADDCDLYWSQYDTDPWYSVGNFLGGNNGTPTPVLFQSRMYRLDCTDRKVGWPDEHASVKWPVTVTPVVDLYANGQGGNSSINGGDPLYLTYSSMGAETCNWTAPYPFAPNSLTSTGANFYSSNSQYPTTAGQTYSINCNSPWIPWISGSVTSPTDSVTVTLNNNPSHTVDLKVNGEDGPSSARVQVVTNQSATASWVPINMDSCDTANSSPGITNWQPNYPSLSIYPDTRSIIFPSTGTYNVIAHCSGSDYTDTVIVDANNGSQAVLNVNSSGVSGVPVTSVSGGSLGGLNTNYQKTNSTTLSGTISVPASYGGVTFTGWTGDCAPASGTNCTVSVAVGTVKNVTAVYGSGSPPPPSPPPAGNANLNIQSSGLSGVYINGVGYSTGFPVVDALGQSSRNYTDYTLSFGADTVLRLWAGSATSSPSFINWTGQCNSASGNLCEVTASLGQTKTVTANFTPPPPPAFDYNLSKNPTNLTIAKGDSGSIIITKTLVTGTSQAVNLSSSPAIPGVTVDPPSSQGCAPTCSSTIVYHVGSSAVAGTYPITITGDNLSKTINFNLTITGAPGLLSDITCSPSSPPSPDGTAILRKTVTWNASVPSNGIPPYTYSWLGTDMSAAQNTGTVSAFNKAYDTIGTKTMTVTVTDSDGSTGTCNPQGSVKVIFSPTIEEF